MNFGLAFRAAVLGVAGLMITGCATGSRSSSPNTVELVAHNGARVEAIDGTYFSPQAAPFGYRAIGNKVTFSTLSPGRHQLAVRMLGLGTSRTGTGVHIDFTASNDPICRFELDLKPGHSYEIMSAGDETDRLEVYDKTEKQLQYFDWGSGKLIADKSPEKTVQDYVAPTLAPQQAVTVKGGFGAYVIAVDGYHVPGTALRSNNFGGNTVMLTPGVHRLVLSRMQSNAMGNTKYRAWIEQEFLPGHVYEVTGPMSSLGLEDKAAVSSAVPVAATAPTASHNGLPYLQAIREAEDIEDDKDKARPEQVTSIVKMLARTIQRNGQAQVDVAADVQLDAVENINFTLRATLLGADGKQVQFPAGAAQATRVIHTADDVDTDTYHVVIPCGATSRSWSGNKVQLELLDPAGATRSSVIQPVQIVNQ